MKKTMTERRRNAGKAKMSHILVAVVCLNLIYASQSKACDIFAKVVNGYELLYTVQEGKDKRIFRWLSEPNIREQAKKLLALDFPPSRASALHEILKIIDVSFSPKPGEARHEGFWLKFLEIAAEKYRFETDVVEERPGSSESFKKIFLDAANKAIDGKHIPGAVFQSLRELEQSLPAKDFPKVRLVILEHVYRTTAIALIRRTANQN